MAISAVDIERDKPLSNLRGITPLSYALARLPRDLALKHRVLPLSLTNEANGDDVLLLAAAQSVRLSSAQDSLRARQEAARAAQAGRVISIHAAPATQARDEYEAAILEIRRFTQVDRLDFVQASAPDIQTKTLESYGQDPRPDPDPIVVDVEAVLRDAVYRRFTDMESEPFERGGILMGRCEQVWIEIRRFTTTESYDRFVRVLKSKAQGPHLNPGTMNTPQDGQFQISLPHRRVDVRVNVLPMRGRESISLRFHELDLEISTPERLGMPADVLTALDEAFQLVDVEQTTDDKLSQPRGVIAWVGPPGVGKTTSAECYTVHRLLPRGIRCAFVADPIERVIEHIAQIEVNDRGGMSFAAISTTLKRRRYDFVMIAEARDQESVDAAFSSAANGKMTGMTLHAGDAIAAPEKLSQEYSVPVTRQAEHIKLIIAQRLVRRLCSDCKAASLASEGLLRFRPSARGATVYTPVGCVVCNGTGFRRELAVFEKFRPTDSFWKAARDGAVASELHAIALEAGFRPMFEHGLDRVLAGETSLSEVVKAVPKPR